MSHVTHIDESCHTYKWFISLTLESTPGNSLRRAAMRVCTLYMDESRHTYAWVTSHIRMGHVTCQWAYWLIVCVCVCVSCQWAHLRCHLTMRACTIDQSMSHMNESCHTYEWVTSHVRMSHVTCEWVMSHVNESCHIWMSHVTLLYVHASLMIACYTWMSHVTHMNESCHTHEWVM